jgi:hypothetical protein
MTNSDAASAHGISQILDIPKRFPQAMSSIKPQNTAKIAAPNSRSCAATAIASGTMKIGCHRRKNPPLIIMKNNKSTAQ